jgi:FKBP-type peptidyl-prolyl cis-trans isomerase
MFKPLLVCLSVALLGGVNLVHADQNSYLKRTGKKYLDGVLKSNPNAKLLKSGMIVEVLKETTIADAKSPKSGDSCEVTYSGTLKDGTKFDSGTTSFAPNQVIKVCI